MANIEEVEALALSLMTEHGVGRVAFSFDDNRTRLGQTRHTIVKNADNARVYVPTRITLSKPFMELLPLDKVRIVILHEIAHALTPGDGHGTRWAWRCVQLGIQPDKTMSIREMAS